MQKDKSKLDDLNFLDDDNVSLTENLVVVSEEKL